MNVIVVPARGGSKRIPRKNTRLLNGKPLICYTLDCIISANLGIPVYVSTDDREIFSLVEPYPGIDCIIRPDCLAVDTASTESVLIHLLDQILDSGISPEWIMTLPPTSPFRSPSSIHRFLSECEDCSNDIDSFMSVTENRGDFWRLSTAANKLERLLPDSPRRQQERAPLYEENSAIYLTKTEALRRTGFILGKGVRGIPLSYIESFDINNEEDLRLAGIIAASL